MKIASLPVILSLPFLCIAQDAARVYYHLDLQEFVAKPSEKVPEHPLQSRRVPGAGALIYEWNSIVQSRENVFRIEGIVRDDNAGVRKQGVSVLIGNLEESKTLRLLTLTDEEGRFSIYIDNRTFDQKIKDSESSEPRYTYVNLKDDGLSEEDIYRINRYLYLGKSGVDLYQYRIPYEDAEAEAEGKSGQRRSTDREGRKRGGRKDDDNYSHVILSAFCRARDEG